MSQRFAGVTVIVDSHALIWWLTGDRRIGTAARDALRQARQVIVPIIVLAELRWLLERKLHTPHNFSRVVSAIRNSSRWRIALHTITDVKMTPLDLEMHDALIVAMAMRMGSKGEEVLVATYDRSIRNCGLVRTVWD